jgi:hypothetical protein
MFKKKAIRSDFVNSLSDTDCKVETFSENSIQSVISGLTEFFPVVCLEIFKIPRKICLDNVNGYLQGGREEMTGLMQVRVYLGSEQVPLKMTHR